MPFAQFLFPPRRWQYLCLRSDQNERCEESLSPHPQPSRTRSVSDRLRCRIAVTLKMKTTLGLRLMGSPRRRITAIIDAAMTMMPFSRAFSIAKMLDEYKTKIRSPSFNNIVPDLSF